MSNAYQHRLTRVALAASSTTMDGLMTCGVLDDPEPNESPGDGDIAERGDKDARSDDQL